jgi:methylated-DNA-[protein]-cysteine S-methyltransferase
VKENMTVTVNVSDERLSDTTMATPVGELRLVASERGLRAVLWPGETAQRVPDASVDAGDAGDAAARVILADAVRQLGEYFAGDRQVFDLPLDPVGTPFQHQAWSVLRAIPYGTTITYGEQASRLGDANKSRAVGAANGRNPISIIVPCHRVVGADGSLTGFAAGLDTKAWLLRHERAAAAPAPTLFP